MLRGYSFLTHHPTAKFHPNRSSFGGNTRENVKKIISITVRREAQRFLADNKQLLNYIDK